MNFDVAGPFEIARHGSKKIITKESAKLLKPQLEEWEEGLSTACGCYVFGKRAGGGITPWYVGQACKTSLLAEALNPTNITNYNHILGEEGAGIPVLLLIPARTPTKKFRKRPSSKLKSLSFLERWLIAAAIQKNPELINTKETRFLRDLHVTGVFNAQQGESTKSSTALNKALGLR
ncbi:hypothetical protein [Xanthomonas sp. LMG 12459]|uniref:hypothetical protein n=1 Tax=Xanthomonas sp. LMG 12459 TaxID=1591131 RepID=UPI0012639A3B|nr:hypothetical protein [Xanthomonas sp. LMG 12459]